MKIMTKLTTAAALAAALVYGQGFGRMGGDRTPPDPAAMIARRVEMLTKLLTLTDAQKTQATTIFTTAQTASSSLRTSSQTARESLSAAIKSNNTSLIDQLSANLGTLSGQLTAIESKADAAFYAILTSDQQSKYDEVPRGGMGGGPGGPGPMRGGQVR